MNQSAYLVIREGSKWSDVFRLVSGQSATIGRAPTNQIVLKDERCSRNHAEVFFSGGQWTLRDLDSRNGTLVGTEMVHGDRLLTPGEVIRIGRTQLVFVHRLSDAFTSSGDASSVVRRVSPDATSIESVEGGEELDVLETCEPTTITHRRVKTRYLAPGEDESSGVSKIGRASAKLCRLAFELAKAPDLAAMAELALSGLAEETQTDAGALLLFPLNHQGGHSGDDLEVIGSRSSSAHRYHRVSNFLAETVMREGEAVLARNVVDDSTLGSRDSQGDILATSVICAPVRHGKEVFGLIHLYSTDRSIVPDPDDLEFTLAVADTVA
ncbi:MAG: FHA domain-containing protein, partial [Pirellulales bacterium]|nr:FHA domain-containing protein [Pirellulales bacterium]